jgi:crotonobetainyl-CoA:carnitine CoA-transferase CaiB-like acyl-CoA transferase
MTGVLDGITVLDLTSGIAGPVVTMLLADHGARVTRIEPPAGTTLPPLSGERVWHRGKRRAELDLTVAADREVLDALVGAADVVVTSCSPATARGLGLDPGRLLELHPRLVCCSITGYGPDGPDAERPAFDALVAARTGQQWEHRGVVGGTIDRLSGGEGVMPGLEPPTPDCRVGPDRDGPLFGGVPWPSMATAYQAVLGISAALRVRARTGVGQQVHTSLLQGVLANTAPSWIRAERYDTPGFRSWIIDPRAPKGFFRAADGRWTHHWTPLPSLVLGVSRGDRLRVPGPEEDTSDGWEVSSPRQSGLRISLAPEDMVLLHHFQEPMRAAVARFPSDEWVSIAAEVLAPVQAVRSPEEALLDPTLLADGCVVEVDDPELGPIRQVGSVYSLSACPTVAPAPPVARGTHTAEVRAEAASAVPAAAPPWERAEPLPVAPLAGIRVLDLGLAVAGPWGTQLLADLGADVVKVNQAHEGYWMGTHYGVMCNRGKRGIALDLKHPDGMAVLHRLVAGADVVQHNMRPDAARRLGVDYASLRPLRPDLIYCQTRGFERGPRAGLPGNDQTGAALAGTTWLDSGLDDDGAPIWTVMSAGDTGNGFLSAIAIVQALLHRDRTGEGQELDTSILYAQLLNASMAWTTPDGSVAGDRQQLDAMHLGWCAGYRLYETADGWLCVAAVTDETWGALCDAVGRPGLAVGQAGEAGAALAAVFRTATTSEWTGRLEAAGVPCEVSDPDWVLRAFDDRRLHERGWLARLEHARLGRMTTMGLLVDLSATPGVVQRAAPVVGQHTRELLAEAGYTSAEIEDLLASRAATSAP